MSHEARSYFQKNIGPQYNGRVGGGIAMGMSKKRMIEGIKDNLRYGWDRRGFDDKPYNPKTDYKPSPQMQALFGSKK